MIRSITKWLVICAMLAVVVISHDSYASRPVIADSSIRTIKIDSAFNGVDVLVFGARNDAGDIVVVVRGPSEPYIVRKKERIAGMWINRQQVKFPGTSSFYRIASSRPLEQIRNDYLLSTLNIAPNHVNTPPKDASPVEKDFYQALFQHQTNEQLYSSKVDKVSFIGDTLFRSVLHFPDNIRRGTYTAEIYLIRSGELIGVQSTPILTYKTGFDAQVYDFAYRHPALYGILAILIALSAGWIAGVFFKKV